MRVPTQAEYDHATAALAVYHDFSKPYVQRNGWTVIPADAPRPLFDGHKLTTDRVNACSTTVELFELARDKPERFTAYVTSPRNSITTWTGEEVGIVITKGDWHRNNMGARWRSVRVRAAFDGVYSGREYDSRQCVNFTRVKHV